VLLLLLVVINSAGSGKEDSAVFFGAAKLGARWMREKNYQQAYFCFRSALQSKEGTVQTEPLSVKVAYADVLYQVGVLFRVLQDNDKSMAALEQCLELRRSCAEHIQADGIAGVLVSLAGLHCAAGDKDYACELLSESLSILLYSEHTALLRQVWGALAEVQEQLGRYDDAKSSRLAAQKLAQLYGTAERNE
jgi:tetratricopeptide (TPR) repeat protein